MSENYFQANRVCTVSVSVENSEVRREISVEGADVRHQRRLITEDSEPL